MVIHKVKSREDKKYQQHLMAHHCIDHWRRLNNADYTLYTDVMNIETYRWSGEHHCPVALTYHFNPNKW